MYKNWSFSSMSSLTEDESGSICVICHDSEVESDQIFFNFYTIKIWSFYSKVTRVILPCRHAAVCGGCFPMLKVSEISSRHKVHLKSAFAQANFKKVFLKSTFVQTDLNEVHLNSFKLKLTWLHFSQGNLPDVQNSDPVLLFAEARTGEGGNSEQDHRRPFRGTQVLLKSV